MRKYLVIIMMLAGGILSLQVACTTTASAQDYWCYTDSAGYEYYVVTDKTEYLIGGKIVGHVKKKHPDYAYVTQQKWMFAFDEGVCWAYCYSHPDLTPSDRKARSSPLALSIVRFLYHYKYGNEYNKYID